jgi:hypothetical protein
VTADLFETQLEGRPENIQPFLFNFLTGILVLLSFFSTKNANESCARADVKDY